MSLYHGNTHAVKPANELATGLDLYLNLAWKTNRRLEIIDLVAIKIGFLPAPLQTDRVSPRWDRVDTPCVGTLKSI